LIGGIMALGKLFSAKLMNKMNKYTCGVFCRFKKIWRLAEQFKLIGDIGVLIISILLFFRGVILIMYSLIGVYYDMPYIYKGIIKYSNIIFMIIGYMFIIIAKEVFHRVKASYRLAMFLLCIDVFTTFMNTFTLFELINTGIVIILLYVFRNQFYRKNIPFIKKGYIISGMFTLILVLIYVFAGPDIQYQLINGGSTKRILFTNREFKIYGILTFVVAWFLTGVYNLFKPKFTMKIGLTKEEIDDVYEFLKENNGNTNTHLIFLKDKKLFWYSDKKVLIAYNKIHNSLIALGDPIGDKSLFSDSILEFQRYADLYGLRVAFYRVCWENFPIYHENGFYFFKLGEEAVVDVENFDLKGKKKQNLRTAKNKFEKNNYKFEILHPPISDEIMNKLRIISYEWLGDRSENRFSIGWFDEEYLNRGPIAVIRNEFDSIIAFASLMPSYDNNKSFSIDLMRYSKNSFNGIMEVLFLYIILWSKENGYKYFSLGMAPLANVGMLSRAHKQEKVAKFIYNFGNHWYNFNGLRRFKDKYQPDWEPRYLAFPKAASLPGLMISIIRYIAKPYN